MNNASTRENSIKDPGYQAFKILQLTFVVAPILAGLDKFFFSLTNWDQYLSPYFHIFPGALNMTIVGIIEIIAGIGVALKPKYFSWIVAIWLIAIIINLLLLGKFYDIALRDLGLALSAFALATLSQKYAD